MSDTNNPGNQTPDQPTTPFTPQPPAAPQGQQPVPPAPPAPPAPQNGYPGAQQPAPQAPMNTLAIVAFVASFFVSIVGIICGHIALGQIKKTGERGRGFALAGTIIGYVALAFTILAIVFTFVMAGIAVQAANSSLSELEQMTEELETPTEPGVEESPTDSSESSGDVSPEFCAALEAISAMGAEASSPEMAPEALESFRALAEIESPNQAAYQAFYEYIQDPMNASNSETVFSDYIDAVSEDSMACM